MWMKQLRDVGLLEENFLCCCQKIWLNSRSASFHKMFYLLYVIVWKRVLDSGHMLEVETTDG